MEVILKKDNNLMKFVQRKEITKIHIYELCGGSGKVENVVKKFINSLYI